MEPSSSTPKPTLPSLQQESTVEEDYFAELLLDDSENDLYEPQPKKKSRKERMRDAVETSKREYTFDHGMSESGWYIGHDRHPAHFDRDRTINEDGWPDVVDLRVIEMNIIQLYSSAQYPQSFSLALRLLCPTSFSHLSPRSLPDNIPDYDSSLRLEWDKIGRDVMDTLLRIAVRERLGKWGRVLAEGAKHIWITGSQGVMADVAARCYLMSLQYLDALVAVCYAISDRSLLRPFLRTLILVLNQWTTVQPESSYLIRMRDLAQYSLSIKKTGDQPLFPTETLRNASLRPAIPQTRPPPLEPSDLDRLGADEADLRTIRKVWVKVEVFVEARKRGGAVDEEEEDKAGRSVRSL